MSFVRFPWRLSRTSMNLAIQSAKPTVNVAPQPFFRYLRQLRVILNHGNYFEVFKLTEDLSFVNLHGLRCTVDIDLRIRCEKLMKFYGNNRR